MIHCDQRRARIGLGLILAFCSLASAWGAKGAEITSGVAHGESGHLAIIRINGPIEAADVEKFRQLSLQSPKAVVVLNSNGGKLFPALEIGKIIKISGYTTVVTDDAVCASSCALIWIAGPRRLLSPKGRVGFHASYYDNNGRLEESGVANALIGNYLTLLDLRERAVAFATSAPPDKILWLTNQNKVVAGIDFEDFVSDGDGVVHPSMLPAENPAPATVQPVSPPSIVTSSHPVTIISANPVPTRDGPSSTWYKFRYMGFTLQRVASSDEFPEDELKEFVDDSVKEENGWLYYNTDSNFVFYYLKVDSIRKIDGGINIWVKGDHKYNKLVQYRTSIENYTIYCRDNKVHLNQVERYDAKGVNVYSEAYSYDPEFIIPDTTDDVLRETLCG